MTIKSLIEKVYGKSKIEVASLIYLIKYDRFFTVSFIFILAVIGIRTSVMNYNYIPSSSMNPNLIEGDVILVDRAAYNYKFPLLGIKLFNHTTPERGDVVTFTAVNIDMVKRVMAKPGDTVELKNNNFIINGKRLHITKTFNKDVEDKVFLKQRNHQYSVFKESNGPDKSYDVIYANGFSKQYKAALIMNFDAFVVPDSHYFFIGDNRNMSKDSRYFGTVHIDDVDGKVTGVVFNYKYFTDAVFDSEGKVSLRNMLKL